MKLAHDPIVDPVVQKKLELLLTEQTLDDIDLESWNIDNYTTLFVDWIKNSNYNTIHGLEQFPLKAYCAGALEGIATFVHRHATTRRLRFSRAEFVASKICSNHAKATWKFIEEEDLDSNDAVIISLPFSGNGSTHHNYDNIIDYCNQHNVPVLIDMAYFGISYDIQVDLAQPCITDVVFSLSKCFSVPMRLGLRLSKYDFDDLIQVNSGMKLINRWAVNAGIGLLKKFSHNWIVEKYRPLQQQICEKYNLMSSNTVTLALGWPEVHDEFMRNGYRRVCITDELLQRL